MIRRRVLVSGRVQGVWFRDSCRRAARSAGVAGWVRNCSDGRVEAVFEGDPDAVLTMVNWARIGPPGAAVVDVDIIDEQPVGEVRFAVR
jgi:acylphosphatase